jgi:3'-phosphoadenosine 5'-phosphosulfate sulfotransferase (PAPS reductase)/FAD synthetase
LKKIIQFSGGKDSVVCLHLFKDDPNITAINVNTGAAFPHVEKFIQKTCDDFGVTLITLSMEKSVIEWQKENGLPADIVPSDSTPYMQQFSKNSFGATLVHYIDCCYENIQKPLQDFVLENNVTDVIRGSKECDTLVGVSDGYTKDGVTYHSPLWNWSHEDVFNYIKMYNIPILDNYKDPDSDSLDCWNCTAYMGRTGAARVRYVKENLPEHYDELAGNIALVKSTVQNAIDYYNEGF